MVRYIVGVMLLFASVGPIDAQYRMQGAEINPIGEANVPAPLAPANGTTNVPLDADSGITYVRLAWTEIGPIPTPLSGGTRNPDFEVQVATDSNFHAPMAADTIFRPIVNTIFFNTIGDSSDWVRGLKAGDLYYWRVRVLLDGHVFPWSATFMFSTSAEIREVPEINLAVPASGYEFPIIAYVNSQVSGRTDTLRWHRASVRINTDGTRDTARYLFICGPDSVKVASADTSLARTVEVDTIASFTGKAFITYYWRVRMYYVTEPAIYVKPARASIGHSAWSEVRSFSNQFEHVSIRTIQRVDSTLLEEGDTAVTRSDAYVQESPLFDEGVTITAECVVPVSVFTKDSLTMIVRDTGAAAGAWHSIMVQPFPPFGGQYILLGLTSQDYQNLASAIRAVRAGDIITLRGFTVENEDTSYMTNTVFEAVSLSRTGFSSDQPVAFPVNLSEFSAGTRNRVSTGEQWEGCFVRMQNLTVNSILDSSKGTFRMIDPAGNYMDMTDESCWFTYSAGRNLASNYTMPRPGQHIGSIEGVIITTRGRYTIAPVEPGDLMMGPFAPHAIDTYVFWDDNADGIQDSGEIAAFGFPLTLSGTAYSNYKTDSTGHAVLGGLDSGSYRISPGTKDTLWSLTTAPSSFPLSFTSAAESLHVSFGFHRNWDDVTGSVFYDLNEDLTREPGEPGIGGWKVTLRGATIDTSVVDPAGNFVLNRVSLGADTVGIIPPPGWEAIYPEYYFQIIVIPAVPGFYYPVPNIAVHPIPRRAKIFLQVHDNSFSRTLKLAFGNRGGATYGIAGVDPAATTFDLSEGELELPPSDFVIQNGYFDVRFLDPHEETNQFGNGSWVDMRDFTSPTQVDTHLVAFYPGYASGGNYPVTLTWDKDEVAADYSGPVVLEDSLGGTTDMKLSDSLVVRNPSITWLQIITEDPNLPLSTSLSWRIVSVPSVPLVDNFSELFSLPQSSLFSFNKPTGYRQASSLLPGVGYWLKFVEPVGALSALSPLPPLPETLGVSEGWNLIGGPGVAIAAGGVSSSPPGILGSIFGFDGGYGFADSLRPFEGYWVNATGSGSIIYGQSAAKRSPGMSASEVMNRSVEIDIADVGGGTHPLRVYTPNSGDAHLPDASAFALPPAPPAGIMDVRFGSGRCLEYAPAGTTTEFAIAVSGGDAYPLTLSMPQSAHAASAEISVKVGNKYMSLGNNASVSITAPVKSITIRVTAMGDAAIPKEFALRQNYPNPFNPTTTLKYDLPVASNVRLDVYDILGRLVKTLVDGAEPAGYQTVEWNAADVSSGTYFYRMEATGVADQSKRYTKAMKMVVVR